MVMLKKEEIFDEEEEDQETAARIAEQQVLENQAGSNFLSKVLSQSSNSKQIEV